MNERVQNQPRQRKYSAHYLKAKHRLNERLKRGLCRQCGNLRGKDGTSQLCRTCADEQSEGARIRRQSFIEAGLCAKCGQPRGKDGTTNYCRLHANEHNARREERAKRRISEGLCVVCNNPRGEWGTKYYCRSCADKYTGSAGARYKRLRDAGLCVWCGEPRGGNGTETLCRLHADAIVANDREQDERLFNAGLCPQHKEPMHLLENCPACLYEESALTASEFSFVGLLPEPSSGDRLEACAGCKKCRRIFHKDHLSRLPHFPSDLQLRDEHVGEEGRGMWLRFSSEDEQERVEIEYEACSLPDDICRRLATRKVALDFLRRHRAGEKLAGACKDHTQDRARLSEALTARLRQQLVPDEDRQFERDVEDAIKIEWEGVRALNLPFEKRCRLVIGVNIASRLRLGAPGSETAFDQLRRKLRDMNINQRFPGKKQWFPAYVRSVIGRIEQTRQ